MLIKTTRFDEIDVDESKIIDFPEGLIGFERYRKFVIVSIEKFKPFLWLQSVDLGDLSFLMTDPWLFFTDYAPEISDDDVSYLKIDDPSSVIIYALISFDKNYKNTNFNLLAPICINHKTNTARQVILTNANYSVCHTISHETIKASKTQQEQSSEKDLPESSSSESIVNKL